MYGMSDKEINVLAVTS